jgi:hypothetical protein
MPRLSLLAALLLSVSCVPVTAPPPESPEVERAQERRHASPMAGIAEAMQSRGRQPRLVCETRCVRDRCRTECE